MADVLWNLQNVGLTARLREVSLQISPGVTAVLGPSGAGKTSLLNLLVRYEQPTCGRCIFSAPATGHALPLCWVPPDGGLWPHMSIRSQLAAVAGNEAVEALLSQFDLQSRADALPGQLSQGERSRAAVARAMATDAAVLVMDEPLVHVDSARLGDYWELIYQHVVSRGCSLIFTTHQPPLVLSFADHVICLRDAGLLYAGPVDPLYRAPSTPELAACLGEANWFTPAQAQQWLDTSVEVPLCLRPEHLQVAPDDDGPCEVVAVRFAGAIERVVLRQRTLHQVRHFYHRPARSLLQAGSRAMLRVLLLVALAFLWSCSDAAAAPVLWVAEVKIWQTPSDGPRIPAPRALAVSPEGLVFALDNAARVMVFDSAGQLLRQWRMPEHDIGNPQGVCVLRDGRVAVADTHYSRIVFFDQQGSVLSMVGSRGIERGQFIYPVSIVQDDQENIYVCEYGSNDRVQKFTREGQFLLSMGSFGLEPGQFQRPSGMVWHEGRLYVADAINNRIQIFDGDGRFQGILGSPGQGLAMHFPYDLTLGSDSTLYVAEYGAACITRISLKGEVLGRFGSSGSGVGQFITPWAVRAFTFTQTGGGRRQGVLVADTGNRRIVEIDF